MSKKLTQDELLLMQQKEQMKRRTEAMKKEVEIMELRSAYQKAEWETMHYALLSEALRADYTALLEKQKAAEQEAIKRFQEQIEKMNKEAQAKEQEKVTLADNKEFLDSLAETKELKAV